MALVPTRRKGDSPIFAAIMRVGSAISTVPQKSGQSPVNDHKQDWGGEAEKVSSHKGSGEDTLFAPGI